MPRKVCGFTIIELIVTVSIFALITGVILANYGKFSSRTVIDNLAHEIALSVRQAQVFGIGVREFGASSGVFPSHGINFNTATPSTFVLFADTNNSGRYDEPERVEVFTLRGGNSIGSICGYTFSGALCTQLSELDITFTRPNPEAKIVGVPDNGAYVYAKITLSSPRGLTRDVIVWSSGQISVQ